METRGHRVAETDPKPKDYRIFEAIGGMTFLIGLAKDSLSETLGDQLDEAIDLIRVYAKELSR